MAQARAGMLLDPGHCLSLGFGSGLVPKAPGTWGSVVGVGLYFLLAPLGPWGYWAATLLVILLGWPLCGRTAEALGEHDHGAIVLDEIAGVLVTLGLCNGSWASIGVGFLAFRLFDIAKPWPIRLADQRVRGGFGIMLDDLIAAGFALLVVEIFEYFS